MGSDSEEELLSLDSDSDEEYVVLPKKKKQDKDHRSEKLLPVNNHESNKSMVPEKRTQQLESSPISKSFDASDDEEANLHDQTSHNSFTREDRGIEITLSDSDEDIVSNHENTSADNSSMTPQPSTSRQDLIVASNNTQVSYSLRRKQKVNYEEIENGPEIDDKFQESKSNQKKDVLDVFSLSTSKINKFKQNPELIESYTKCKIVFMHGTDSSHLKTMSKFFGKCGRQFERLFIQIRYDEENYSFLESVFKSCSQMSRLDYRYQNLDDAYKLLKLLRKLSATHSLPSLTSIKLVSVSGSESLRDKHIALLSEICMELKTLEIGDALWEDVEVTTIERLLNKQKLCLETLIINGGFRGDTEKESKLISFPKMEALKTLCICPKYAFVSEIKNPHSKKARVITLEIYNKEEPYKIAIKFTSDLPKLERLVLGNLIDIEDLLFSSVRKLSEFRCGSYWNLSIRFPSEGSRKTLLESSVTEFQFPDALKDPLFTVKVAKHFPNIKKVWLYLPSVPVLRAFFKAFENSQVEELYLKTQFDFEKTMESCLLPNMQDVLQKSPATETILQTLKQYKHFDEYIRYYNVELPVEAEDLMEGHSAGIGALKCLKVLHLEHVPRKLLIPIPDDERKWYDHNCKFMSTTFGYESYPLNYKCHNEILKLDLSEYIWRNIQISSSYTEDFYEAGFVDIPDVEFVCESNASYGYRHDSDEEDIFTPIKKSTPTGAQVKIMPSMLMPNIKAKPEEM